jgi:hypothetical protein
MCTRLRFGPLTSPPTPPLHSPPFLVQPTAGAAHEAPAESSAQFQIDSIIKVGI